MHRPKTPIAIELPLIVFLSVIWMTVWQSFDLGTFIFGLILGGVIVRVFYLPPLRRSGRFNVFWALFLTIRFLGKMVVASFHISWLTVSKGPNIKNAIIGVQLRSHDDLIITLTGHFLSLVPGSLVVEVDRTTATVYLHVINVYDYSDADSVRRDALRTEELFIRVLGNRSDLAVTKAENRLGRAPGLSDTEITAPRTAGGKAPGASLPAAGPSLKSSVRPEESP